MDKTTKNTLLANAKNQLTKVRDIIQESLSQTKDKATRIADKLFSLPSSQQPLQSELLKRYTAKSEELESLYSAPYFTKCEIKFDNETESRIFYFSKHSYPEQNIFSWVTPAAAMRFEQPGHVSYVVDSAATKSGSLISKDQYLITDGKLVFMATESLTQPRELIYQEYFSNRKSTFALPEIVEQMEKAQDAVIRAHPKGSFLISGPAGSGKTTLALHRVAYLVQSPDTSQNFTEDNIIVFVQDASTKAYFGTLLPELGINNVTITTFPDWVKSQLKLYEYKFIVRYGKEEAEQDLYEYEKNACIQSGKTLGYSDAIYSILGNYYNEHFSESSKLLFKKQHAEKVLDRFDLTLLMKSFLFTHKNIFTEETEYKQLKGGRVQRKKILKPLQYALIILDEVQNYLPAQIEILKQCVNPDNHAVVYVGDLAQQTQLCTIRDWSQAGELFQDDRKAKLQKNYRSTQQILEYITSLGYDISIPVGLKQGPAVIEKVVSTQQQELEYVTKLATDNPETTIGILGKTTEYISPLKAALTEHSNVHVLTINEAQGVEFNIVCIVGVDTSIFTVPKSYTVDLQTERRRVNKDLIYVALTRAINELHIIGPNSMKEVVQVN